MENKKNFTIVTQYNESLIDSVEKTAFVVRCNDPKEFMRINDHVNNRNRLHCILTYWNEPLSNINFEEHWKKFNWALHVPTIGFFRAFADRLRIVRQLQVKIFLTTDLPENYTNIRILASLGIPCGLDFGEANINWDMVDDLMHYAVYSKAKHAPIDPFSYVTTYYDANDLTDFSSIYYENPLRFVHASLDGKIALTSTDLENNVFIANSIEELEKIPYSDIEEMYKTRWQEFFLRKDGCAYCQSWRVCQGKFQKQAETNPGCKDLLAGLMEAADYITNAIAKQKN